MCMCVCTSIEGQWTSMTHLPAGYLGDFVWLILFLETEGLIGLEFTSTIGWPLSPEDLPVSVISAITNSG